MSRSRPIDWHAIESAETPDRRELAAVEDELGECDASQLSPAQVQSILQRTGCEAASPQRVARRRWAWHRVAAAAALLVSASALAWNGARVDVAAKPPEVQGLLQSGGLAAAFATVRDPGASATSRNAALHVLDSFCTASARVLEQAARSEHAALADHARDACRRLLALASDRANGTSPADLLADPSRLDVLRADPARAAQTIAGIDLLAAAMADAIAAAGSVDPVGAEDEILQRRRKTRLQHLLAAVESSAR